MLHSNRSILNIAEEIEEVKQNPSPLGTENGTFDPIVTSCSNTRDLAIIIRE